MSSLARLWNKHAEAVASLETIYSIHTSSDDVSWVADPDVTGTGVFFNSIVTASLSLVVLTISIVLGYRDEAASVGEPYRLRHRLLILKPLSDSLLDSIVISDLGLFLSFCMFSRSHSAFTRAVTQHWASINNFSLFILLDSTTPHGIKHLLQAAATSLISLTLLIGNALHTPSIPTELAWLASRNAPDVHQEIDHSPHSHAHLVVVFEISCLLIVFISLISENIARRTRLACLVAGSFGLAANFITLGRLYSSYEPFMPVKETSWSFDQAISSALVCTMPAIYFLEAMYQFRVRTRGQQIRVPVDEHIPLSQTGSWWYFYVVPVLLFMRKGKTFLIVAAIASVGFVLFLLLRWVYVYPTPTPRHAWRNIQLETLSSSTRINTLTARLAQIRNFLRYVVSLNPSSTNYAATPLAMLPSEPWQRTEKKLAPGYKRISWQCSCGETLAAHFDNSNPGALVTLEQRLQSMNNTGVSCALNQQHVGSAAHNSATGRTQQGASSSAHGLGGTTLSRGGGNSNANSWGVTHRSTASSSTSQKSTVPRYFELCASVGQYSVSLGEINISSVTTDGQLFEKIWEGYHDIRSSSFWGSVRSWFFKPDDIFFIHFGVTQRHQVGVYGKPMVIPPPEEVDQGRYHYHECPMQPLPPMPDHIFLHYLDRARKTGRSRANPQVHSENIFLDRLPKKLGSSIFTTGAGAGAGSAISYGWGVHILERPSALAQSMVGIVSALLCLVIFGVTWIFGSLDTATGIGQFVAGVLALLNAAIYFALQAFTMRVSRRTH